MICRLQLVEYKTFITQEMLKKNILATNLVFTNIFHTKKIIDQYAHELDKIFNKIKVIEDSKKKIKFLDGKVRESTFARLTD